MAYCDKWFIVTLLIVTNRYRQLLIEYILL